MVFRMVDHLASLVKKRPFWWRGEAEIGEGMLLLGMSLNFLIPTSLHNSGSATITSGCLPIWNLVQREKQHQKHVRSDEHKKPMLLPQVLQLSILLSRTKECGWNLRIIRVHSCSDNFVEMFPRCYASWDVCISRLGQAEPPQTNQPTAFINTDQSTYNSSRMVTNFWLICKEPAKCTREHSAVS